MGSRTHGVWANDNGDDAPLTPGARRRYRWLIGGVIVTGMLLVLLFR